MRRSSCISVANELQLGQIARNVQNIRSGTVNTDSSDSESDVEDKPSNKKLANRRKSTLSIFSTRQRANSLANSGFGVQNNIKVDLFRYLELDFSSSW